jgi:hypothetical protein
MGFGNKSRMILQSPVVRHIDTGELILRYIVQVPRH